MGNYRQLNYLREHSRNGLMSEKQMMPWFTLILLEILKTLEEMTQST